jgi:tRNA-2-methylthio-N6-dimethylallyladenosine synthase
MEWAGYEYAYMFNYSERPKTLAERKYKDDVPHEVKNRRLQEVIALQTQLSLASNKRDIGKTFKVLVEGTSKKNENELYGRNSQNKVIVFPKENFRRGDYAMVTVKECTSATLRGEAVKSSILNDES